MKLPLSICMIVKNEETVLAKSLESVKDIASEIIVVDTGSTDNTKKIAEDYGAKVYDFEWINDFELAVRQQPEVAGFDIAMDDAGRVGVVESLGRLDQDVDLMAEREWGPCPDDLTEFRSLEQIHREKRPP